MTKGVSPPSRPSIGSAKAPTPSYSSPPRTAAGSPAKHSKSTAGGDGPGPAFGYRFIADELPAAGSARARTGRQIVFSAADLERVRQESGRGEPQGLPAGPRRSGRPQIHHRCTKYGAADCHHRACHRRGHAAATEFLRPYGEPCKVSVARGIGRVIVA